MPPWCACVRLPRHAAEFGHAAPPLIVGPADVWNHVKFGDEVILRRHHGDRAVYVSVSCSCPWEIEHGLQIVFRNGEAITKLGPYDDHLTNDDALPGRGFENVVYVSS